MSNYLNQYRLILEMNKLKLVFRNTKVLPDRKESTAEHSWSVSMILMILMEQLKKEFNAIDELKIIKMALIHDVVEIYAGDVIAFDIEARKNKVNEETEALQKLVEIYPVFGKELHDLWHESEKRETIEAKIVKAADAICPSFCRLEFKQSYFSLNVTIKELDQTKLPSFEFSQTFKRLYAQLKTDLLAQKLIL